MVFHGSGESCTLSCLRDTVWAYRTSLPLISASTLFAYGIANRVDELARFPYSATTVHRDHHGRVAATDRARASRLNAAVERSCGVAQTPASASRVSSCLERIGRGSGRTPAPPAATRPQRVPSSRRPPSSRRGEVLWEREGAGLGSQGAACRSESAGAASPYCCPPPRIGTRVGTGSSGRVVRVLRDLVFSVLLWVGSVV